MHSRISVIALTCLWKILVQLTEGFAPSLFRAEAMLPVHALTLEDTKKQLLGIPDIQNVWVYKVTEGRKQIFFNSEDNHLQGSATENAIALVGCDVE